MKNVRLNLTENEKIAQSIVGLESNATAFHMGADNDIKNLLQKEKQSKFNDKVDEYVEKLEEHTKSLKESQEKLGYDITKLEIKQMFSRILITLFDQNPFQRIKMTNGIITDFGGLAPTYKNTDSGEIEEAQQQIIVGVIQEIGPEVKYVKPGDTIFLDRASARPVPFYKQGFYCMAENQIIAVVNENLEARFNEVKENGRD